MLSDVQSGLLEQWILFSLNFSSFLDHYLGFETMHLVSFYWNRVQGNINLNNEEKIMMIEKDEN
jgi:hypothetical protein